jgi:hypothetical protein
VPEEAEMANLLSFDGVTLTCLQCDYTLRFNGLPQLTEVRGRHC